MPLNIRYHKYRKFVRPFIILIILINSYVIFQSFNNDSDPIEQPNTYNRSQASKLNSTYIQRAILVFYPSDQDSHYLPEIQWFYRSWIEMMKYESKHWRTDFIIYTGQYSSSLQQLGCILNQIRTNNTEQPQCRIFLYLRVSHRKIDPSTHQQTILINGSKPDLFQIDAPRSIVLFEQLKTYSYIDSVNIIAEAYPTYRYYDVVLKTDIDVFITTQFAKYIPDTNITLLAGLGGYSTDFNTRRLGRVARDMNWKYQNMTNIGSTWYGSPYVAHRIANLALDAMIYLIHNEFSRVEQEQKLGVLLWPDWHYGVLSMYGTHLAVNHLSISEQLDIKKADQLFDQSTTDPDQHNLEKNNRLHLHCWHTDLQFSKFVFKAGKYNHIHPRTLIKDKSAQAYATRMALESRLMTLGELGQRLHDIGQEKIK